MLFRSRQYVPIVQLHGQGGLQRSAQVHEDVIVVVKRGFRLRLRGIVGVLPVTPEHDDVVHQDIIWVRTFEDLQADYQPYINDKRTHGKEHPGVGMAVEGSLQWHHVSIRVNARVNPFQFVTLVQNAVRKYRRDPCKKLKS